MPYGRWMALRCSTSIPVLRRTGPLSFNDKAGATVIGARDFLIAYNANLNTKSVRRANSVAFDVREQGRFKTDDGTPAGEPVLDEKGEKVRVPGMLKHVKAIGWY